MFLAPLALAALLLLALPVLIHLLVRRRAVRLDFPTLRYLRETPSFRIFPRRVRQPALLALRLLALALLVLALSRPYASFIPSKQQARVILIDASLSMSTHGRTEAAREQARAIINRLGPNERAAIIAFSSEAQVVVPLTSDKNELLRALESYRAYGGAADYRAGLAQARALLEHDAQGTLSVDLISDFQQSNMMAQAVSLAEGMPAPILTHPVGTEIERNAYLVDETALRTARGLELSASEIVSEMDGQSGTRRAWTLDAFEAARSDIEWRTENNGQLTGRLKALAPDDFDADDDRFFALTMPREGRILLVAGDGDASAPYLRAALEAATSVDGRGLLLEEKSSLPSDPAGLSSYALVVHTLRGATGEGEARVLADYARAGGSVWLCMARDLDATAWNALASAPAGAALPFASLSRTAADRSLSFGPIDSGAPTLRTLRESGLASLRAVSVSAGFALTPRDEAATLMRWSDGTPAFLYAKMGAGEMLLLGTSPEREASDLGLSVALPALASAIVREAVRPVEPLSRNIGEPVYLDVPPGAFVRVTDMNGRMILAATRSLISHPLSIFPEPGIYRVEYDDTRKFLAFNTHAAESSRSLSTAEAIQTAFKNDESARPETSAQKAKDAAERRGHLWRLFLCASFILLVAELFFAMRRQRGDPMLEEAVREVVK